MQRTTFYAQISKNKRDSLLLTVFVVLVVVLLVYVMARIFLPESAILLPAIAVLFMMAQVQMSYNYGDQIVLKATNAQPADPIRNIHLVNTVEGLSLAAGVPTPKVYVVESNEINAFAVGRDPEHASIAVTTGALGNLDRNELEGVIGHEISHISNFDIRFMTIVAVLVGLAGILSHMLLRMYWYGGPQTRRGERGREGGLNILILVGIILAVIAPLVSRLVQAFISRRREFLADSSGAQLTRYPEGLASALEKIKNYNRGSMDISESISHLFISDPNRNPLDELFATHPPLEERIRILRAM
jgi:heat shock protein HtpX